MAIRKLDQSAPEFIRPKTDWHHFECKLITPLYGGGVESATVDKNLPIRGSAIRGQLRFWWRILAKNLWMKDQTDIAIQKAEFALWGGMGEAAHASQVFIKVENQSTPELEDYKTYAPQYSTLGYVFFPADNNKDESKQTLPCELLKEDFTWTLSLKFATGMSPEITAQVVEALRWWSQFGGLGSRSRRGTGAFIIERADDAVAAVLNPVTVEEAAEAGCTLVLKNSQPNALSAWKTGIEKLQSFRQAPNIGRNPGQQANRPGRSRWPEPDAIRRIQKTHGDQHEPYHPAGNIFPRGLFGMPVIYHFVGRGEPNDTHLQPLGKERMASRLLLRPYYQRDKMGYSPAALLLPYQDLLTLEVGLKDSRADKVSLWDNNKAELIQPVKDNNGTNPLAAFMNFFQKG